MENRNNIMCSVGSLINLMADQTRRHRWLMIERDIEGEQNKKNQKHNLCTTNNNNYFIIKT